MCYNSGNGASDITQGIGQNTNPCLRKAAAPSSYCCATNFEKSAASVACGSYSGNPCCDGSELNAGGVASACCYNDDYVACEYPPCSDATACGGCAAFE